MGRKRKHGWHLFVCLKCGYRWWIHSKNPNYGRQPCKGCGTTQVENRGFDDSPQRRGDAEACAN